MNCVTEQIKINKLSLGNLVEYKDKIEEIKAISYERIIFLSGVIVNLEDFYKIKPVVIDEKLWHEKFSNGKSQLKIGTNYTLEFKTKDESVYLYLSGTSGLYFLRSFKNVNWLQNFINSF